MFAAYDIFIFTLIMQSQSAKFALITSTLPSNREYIIRSKTPLNGIKFYKTQKYVLLTRQYVITNVKYTKQNCILY